MAKKNSKLAALLFGPGLVITGIMALWQNEGRFDYYAAAREAQVIETPVESPADPIAYTDSLRTDIPIEGVYVTRMTGYHRVNRHAEIYSWEKSTDSDGNTTWSRGWHSRLQSNSRNSGLHQRLSSAELYPDRYQLGGLRIDPRKIHFVDDSVWIPTEQLSLSQRGRSLGLRPAGDYFYLDKDGNDMLGDERLSYRAIPNASRSSYFGTISGGRGVALEIEQRDGFISTIIADDGILHHLVNGDRETALAKIKADIMLKRWLVRAGGTVAIVIGFFIFFSLFASLLYRIPVIGPVFESGVFLLSLVLGVSLALMVVAVGLVFHNPLTLALPLALIVAGLMWFGHRAKRTGRNAEAALQQRMARKQPHAPQPISPEPTSGESRPLAGSTEGLDPRPREQSAIERTFLHLAALVMADGKVHKKELKFMSNWANAHGIEPARMTTLVATAEHDPNAAGEATREDLELLALMALTDGSVSAAEWDLLRKVAAKLGLAQQDLRDLLHDIENGNPARLAN